MPILQTSEERGGIQHLVPTTCQVINIHFHVIHITVLPRYEIEVIVPIFQMRKLSSEILSILPQITSLALAELAAEALLSAQLFGVFVTGTSAGTHTHMHTHSLSRHLLLSLVPPPLSFWNLVDVFMTVLTSVPQWTLPPQGLCGQSPGKGFIFLRRGRWRSQPSHPHRRRSLNGAELSHPGRSWLGWFLSPLSIDHGIVLPQEALFQPSQQRRFSASFLISTSSEMHVETEMGHQGTFAPGKILG